VTSLKENKGSREVAKFVTFGEIMLRLACPGHRRLSQTIPGALSATFAGSESNVAAALAGFGDAVQFVTALPHGAVTSACLSTLRAQGVDVSRILKRNEGRFGQFFVETGANQRPTQIQYDRDGSCVSLAGADEYEWNDVLETATWLHVSGITPALSENAFQATLQAVRLARQSAVTVSLDVNYRSALWRWDGKNQPVRLAIQTLQELLPFVDVLFSGSGDATLLGVENNAGGRANAGRDPMSEAIEFCESLVLRYPQLRYIAVALRVQQSASSNGYGAGLFDTARNVLLSAPEINGQFTPWPIHQIVDRVGAGDAFAGGLLHGFAAAGLDDPSPLQQILEFATAAGCLAHSVEGDQLCCSEAEVQALVDGDSSGRVRR
jgi:2-dehydro-3-deoxygluconokinase